MVRAWTRSRGWCLFLLALSMISAFVAHTNAHPNRALVEKWGDHVSNIYATLLFWREGTGLYTRPTGELLGWQHPPVANAPPADSPRSEPSQGAAPLPAGVPPQGAAVEPPRAAADELPWAANSVFIDASLTSGPIYIVSPHLPRHYPPGLYLALTPLALAFRTGWLSAGTTYLLAILIFAAFALACGVVLGSLLLTNSLMPMNWGSWIFFALSTMELVRWALNGMYDSVGVFFLLIALVSLTQRRWSRTYFWYALALFVHFRSLWLMPLGLFALVQWWLERARATHELQIDHGLRATHGLRADQCRTLGATTLAFAKDPWLVAGTILGLISIGTFLLAMPGLKDLPVNNSLYLGAPNVDWLRVTMLVAASLALAVWLVRRPVGAFDSGQGHRSSSGTCAARWFRAFSGRWFSALIVLWPLLMWLATPLIQQWYVLFLIPLALAPERCLLLFGAGGDAEDGAGAGGATEAGAGADPRPLPRESTRLVLASVCWVLLVAILLMRNSPFEFRFLRELF